MSETISIVVLAAGKGTRMRNGLRKVLHPMAGQTLIAHVLGAANAVNPDQAVMVLAPGMDDVFAACQAVLPHAQMVIQEPAQGTGHAVQIALPVLKRDGYVAVVFGDTPLLTGATLSMLTAHAAETKAAVTVLGMRPPDPSGYGRLRTGNNGDLVAIIEDAHADDALKANAACNSGVMVFDAAKLPELIGNLQIIPEKNEYYLTDCVGLAIERGWRCTTIDGPWQEGMGVNSQAHLAEAHALYQARARGALLASGVIMEAPETVYLAYDTVIEPGAVIEPFVVFGPKSVVKGGATVRAHSHVEGAIIGSGTVVGPYARLRPGTDLGDNCRIGNFVETKNAVFGTGSKANHLSYIGDASLGTKVNIGAGTITCNYDGFNKHRTVIGNDVFVGSNSALVAPVTIGDGATIGAGSAINRNVEKDTLAIERAPQDNKIGMAARLRRRMQQMKEKSKK